MESRRYARGLQREMAENAETSGFKELQSFLDVELQQIANRTVESGGAILKRLDELERGLRSAGEQSGNTLAAYIGEIDDRLKRSSGLKVLAQTAKLSSRMATQESAARFRDRRRFERFLDVRSRWDKLSATCWEEGFNANRV